MLFSTVIQECIKLFARLVEPMCVFLFFKRFDTAVSQQEPQTLFSAVCSVILQKILRIPIDLDLTPSVRLQLNI